MWWWTYSPANIYVYFYMCCRCITLFLSYNSRVEVILWRSVLCLCSIVRRCHRLVWPSWPRCPHVSPTKEPAWTLLVATSVPWRCCLSAGLIPSPRNFWATWRKEEVQTPSTPSCSGSQGPVSLTTPQGRRPRCDQEHRLCAGWTGWNFLLILKGSASQGSTNTFTMCIFWASPDGRPFSSQPFTPHLTVGLSCGFHWTPGLCFLKIKFKKTHIWSHLRTKPGQC